jgi:hypothetical protein
VATLNLLFNLALVALLVWLHARIARKAGYSPLWALTILLPPVYLVTAWAAALVPWPRDDELDADRAGLSNAKQDSREP